MAPTAHVTATAAARRTVLVVVALLVGTLVVLAAPVATPTATALTNVQANTAPSVPSCQDARLHTFFTIATCSGIDITSQIRVNGADVAAGHSLAIGDVITVSVTVRPEGGHDAMYTETIDAIRNSYFDIDAVIPITLPSGTGSVLSAPTNVSMSRTDLGDRGSGPLINCWLHSGDDAPRNDPTRAISLGAGPVGASGMAAAVQGDRLVARWTTMTADRCVDVLSNNGFYPGHTVQFSQTVISRPAAEQLPTWGAGQMSLATKDGSRSLTWGSAWAGALRVPAAQTPGPPLIGPVTAGDGQVTVSWTPPASTGGSPITGYVVVPYIGEVAQPPRTFSTTATTQTVAGLTNGTAHTFRVAAVNGAGTGSPSGPSEEVTPRAPATIPGPPRAVEATAGDAQAVVTWGAPEDVGGAPVSGYVVSTHVGGVEVGTQSFPSTATTQTISGLTNGTAHTFRVAAVTSFGAGPRSPSSNAVTPTAPATVPGSPTISSVVAGNQQASVYWAPPTTDGGSPITGYVITPSIGGLPQTPVAFPGTAIPQVVTGLVNGTAYTFTVRAVNAVGEGPASAPSTPVTPSDVARRPGPPSGVAATAGSGQATVSWTPPSDDGGLPVSGYVVTPYLGTAAQAARTFTTTATTQVITGLTNGSSYTFRVAAVNPLGTGSPSAPSDPVTPQAPASAPAAPSSLVGTAGDTVAHLTWTAPTSNGGSPITGYVVTPYIGSTPQTPRSFASAATAQTITGLTNGTGYRFRVAATNAVGTGTQSALSATVTPFGPQVPGTPTIGAVRAGDGEATVLWSAPASNGGSPITAYDITPFVGTTPLAAVRVDPDVTSHVVTGLTNGTTYRFRVAAVNAIGTGTWSALSGSVTPTPPATVPGAPTIGSPTASNASVTVRWTAPASNGGSAIVGYVVTPSIAGVAQAPIPFASSATTQTVGGLVNGTTYTFQVQAVNAVGASAPSAASVPVTPQPIAPSAPVIGEVTAGQGRATVRWTAPASDGGSPITAYVVTPYIGTSARPATTFPSTVTTQVVTGLTNGTAYRFRVAAVNAVGTSAPSSYSATVTPTATVPGAPTIGVVVTGDGQVTLSWTAPVDTGGSPVTGYVVTPSIGQVDEPATTFSSTATTQVVTGLTNGRPYRFQVAAVNAVGTGPRSRFSTVANPAPPPTRPGAPTIVAAVAGDGQVTLSWLAPPSDGGSPITAYVVTPRIDGVRQAPITFTSTSTTQVVTDLTNGTTYQFLVAATSAHGTGYQSRASARVTPTAGGSPP